MKVFIVEQCEYDYSPILGIFSTEELAKEFVQKEQLKDESIDFSILEFTLDEHI